MPQEEDFGLVALEAQACGKPVIYSDIPAIKDLLQDDEIGYFVNPNNENEIMEKLSKYISNNVILEKHSKKGRDLVERLYNWEMIEKNLISFNEHNETLSPK